MQYTIYTSKCWWCMMMLITCKSIGLLDWAVSWPHLQYTPSLRSIILTASLCKVMTTSSRCAKTHKISGPKAFSEFRFGCFLKWWYPPNTPKWSFLVGKPMVVGYHHFRKPLFLMCKVSGPTWHPAFWTRAKGQEGMSDCESIAIYHFGV